MSGTVVTVLAGLVIVAGVVGTVLPFVPGLWLSWAGVLFWAIFADANSGRWAVLGVASLITAGGLLFKYVVPGMRMRSAGVPALSIMVGGVLGIIGFFLIPVIGLVIGFVGGVFLAELMRLGDAARAWPSAWQAVTAVGLSLLIELGPGSSYWWRGCWAYS